MTSSLLAGRTALVTGASRGIGMAIAERFAAEGATVAVTARTVEAGTSQFDGSLEETVLAVTKDGGHAVAIPADLSRPEERERLIRETEAFIGPIDILVNNAAVTFFNPIADFAPKRQQLMFEVQVYAPMDLAAEGPSRHGRGRPGMDSQHLFGRVAPPLAPAGPDVAWRQHGVRDGQGGPGAVYDGVGRGGVGSERRGQLALSEQVGAHPWHGLSPSGPPR